MNGSNGHTVRCQRAERLKTTGKFWSTTSLLHLLYCCSQLVPQLRGIFMAMCGHGMLDRRIEHFLFLAGNFQAAVLLARIISAVDRFSHGANLCQCILQIKVIER